MQYQIFILYLVVAQVSEVFLRGLNFPLFHDHAYGHTPTCSTLPLPLGFISPRSISVTPAQTLT